MIGIWHIVHHPAWAILVQHALGCDITSDIDKTVARSGDWYVILVFDPIGKAGDDSIRVSCIPINLLLKKKLCIGIWRQKITIIKTFIRSDSDSRGNIGLHCARFATSASQKGKR